MKKIKLIILREYLTRVKKRTFILMTIIGPILMASLIIVPNIIAKMSDEKKTIAVIDDSGIYINKLESNPDIKFTYIIKSIDQAKKEFDSDGFDVILHIPDNNVPNRAYTYSKKQMGLGVKSHIQNSMKYVLESFFMKELYSIDRDTLKAIENNNRVMLETKQIDENGFEQSSSTELSTAIGFLSGFIIYIFIFMFGSLVMRGVIEEKTSRIVEIIVSSVKPVQLMFGKIIGVAMVGLTQFLLWIILTTIIVQTYNLTTSMNANSNTKQTEEMMQIKNISQTNNLLNNNQLTNTDNLTSIVGDVFKSVDILLILLMFLFYFIGGYLLYASLFAAIGSAVDNEADTQQFMLPITIPLIFALIMAQFITNNPDGPIAFWLSIIPLTSPVIMMVRIPFGVPINELILSATLLIFGFVFTTWIAAKIYRTGILMYGKKITYKELWKWLKYKN